MTARDQWVWVFEIGTRAALYAEARPRDLRWFRNLYSKGQMLRQIDRIVSQ